MNTPLVTSMQSQLQSATGPEAVVAASMSLQMALLRAPHPDLQAALDLVLPHIPSQGD